ncbi:ParB/RepB/Spo0J family partition protein [Sphingomonas panni]|uniref:ParB/RepB/Spo0J family partition protein n=1 Tax=Sphingomonas panni TaxID=237612 RepID=UPI001F5BDC28|nr:ParB/RepB/Spo0J family partition protein [Sphingomonas panni]
MAAAVQATNVANDDAPQVAGEILLLDPREIIIGERLRKIDTVWAEALGKSMQRDGQIHPIDVCQIDGRWHLAGPGGHRLTGAIAAGIPVEAREVSSDAQSRRRREAVENVLRRDNDPVERATAIAELVRLHKMRVGIDPTRSGAAIAADVRWQKAVAAEAADANDTMSLAYGWSQEVAEQIGFTKRTVERDLMLYRRLKPSLVEQLRIARHPILSNATQLRTLAKLEGAEQVRAVGLLLSGEARAIGDAVKVVQNRPAPDRGAKLLSAFLGAFERMTLSERKGALETLRPMLPAGFSLGGDA